MQLRAGVLLGLLFFGLILVVIDVEKARRKSRRQ